MEDEWWVINGALLMEVLVDVANGTDPESAYEMLGTDPDVQIFDGTETRCERARW